MPDISWILANALDRLMNYRICLFSLIIFAGCSDSREYKIKFDHAERLAVGDEIFIRGVHVGEVEDLAVGEDEKVLVTISITKDIKVTEGSKFILQSDFGFQHVEIELANMDNKLIGTGRLQIGEIRSMMDTTGLRKITREEFDSMIQVNPGAKLADTLVKVFREIYKDKKKTGG